MSEEIKKDDIEKDLEFKSEWSGDIIWLIVLLSIFGFGFGNNENPRINELEKKVARLEGQMSMIGGKIL